MPRRSTTGNPEITRVKLVELLEQLPHRLESAEVAEQVNGLVEVNMLLRELGASIAAALPNSGNSGISRLLAYLRYQAGRIVHTEELMIVAGIGDYPRRVRELRANHGWPIISGSTVQDIRADAGRDSGATLTLGKMATDEYLLIEDVCDRKAIARWKAAAAIRERHDDEIEAVRDYFRSFPSQRITAEELRFVAGSSDWPTVVRALLSRGMRIRAQPFGDAELPAGLYVAEE